MPSPFSPTTAHIAQRLPAWLLAATPDQRKLLETRIRASHKATRAVREVLGHVQDIDTYCRPLLRDALTAWFPDSALPDLDQAIARSTAPRHESSLLNAALQNFDSDAKVTLYATSTAVTPLPLDPARFVKVVRNLDLGQRYQQHLREFLDNDAYRQLLQDQDRSAFAAELSLARLQGRIDSRGEMLGEAVLAARYDLPSPDGATRHLQCSRLSLFGIALNGPLLIRLEPRDGIEPCILYLPGSPQAALRQYASLRSMGAALTRQLWDAQFRNYFSRFVGHMEQSLFVERLLATLYPSYPYDSLQQQPPVLEKGATRSWWHQVFPPVRSIWQQTLDKTARLPWDHAARLDEPFAARARHRVVRTLEDAASIAVPLARHDAAEQLARLQHWLQLGMTLGNIAGLFIPALGAVMMVVGAAQVVDEFIDGVQAANEGDSDAAIEHLFGVIESLAQFAALGAAASYLEVAGPLQDWHLIEQAGTRRLWNGEIAPFSRTAPWPTGTPASADGFIRWQDRCWFEAHGRAYPVERDTKGRWRLLRTKTHVNQPALQGHAASPVVLEHERPLTWPKERLLQRLTPAASGLDDTRLEQALRCSGYSEGQLRRAVTDHQRAPALLLDTLQDYGASGLAPAPAQLEASEALARHFPSLSARVRAEILGNANTRDVLQLRDSGRLPIALGESARLYLREARLSRALAAFNVDNGAQADRDLLAIAYLRRLPGWTDEVRLELRQRHSGGELLQAAGAPSEQAKVIVRKSATYTAEDERGQSLGNDGDLFQAILQALPDSERIALNIEIHQPQCLRQRLFDLAANDRSGCATTLGMKPIRPFLRLPTRQPGDPRLGYRLSGRGQGLVTPDALFDELFPASEAQARQALRERLQLEAGDAPEALLHLLQRLREDYQRLDSTLELWIDEPTNLPPALLETRRSARAEAARRLRCAWRRENPESIGNAANDLTLQLDARWLGGLPALPVRLPHVRALLLNGLPNAEATTLGVFLEAVPGLNHLDLASNHLSRLPTQIGNLRNIRHLDLAENFIDFNHPHNLDVLIRLRKLQHLNLNDGTRLMPVSALQRLAQLPHLQSLSLDLNLLDFSTEHFEALVQWPSLQRLSLADNNITLTEQSCTALTQLSRLRHLSLQSNPLERSPDFTHWRHLEVLDLQDTEISEWPAGLSERLNQRPLRLRQLDLSGNLISEIPPLADSAFADAVRANEDIQYDFDGNPLADTTLQRLSDAGLQALPRPHLNSDWYADWPDALQEHIALTAPDPQWQPLYALFARLSDTADYQHNPLLMDQRMRSILSVLAEPRNEATGGGWGRAELQQQIVERLNDAVQTCVDQASLLFQQTETDVLIWQAVSNAGADVDDRTLAVNTALALLRQAILDERVGTLYNARVARRQALANATSEAERLAAPLLAPDDDLADEVLSAPDLLLDEIEMVLDARRRLQASLTLPAQPDAIAFGYLAHLSEATLERLGQATLTAADAQRFVDWSMNQAFWRTWLRRLNPQAFEAQNLQWEGASDYHTSLSEPSDDGGAYVGAAVPDTYIQALEQRLGEVDGLVWRVDGVLQRVDLVSDRYPDESELFRIASELLLQTRRTAEDNLIGQLSLDLFTVRQP